MASQGRLNSLIEKALFALISVMMTFTAKYLEKQSETISRIGVQIETMNQIMTSHLAEEKAAKDEFSKRIIMLESEVVSHRKRLEKLEK